MKEKNLRNMKMTAGEGEDAKESTQLTGEAHMTKAFKSSNETEQYSTGKTSMGPLGGLPSGE